MTFIRSALLGSQSPLKDSPHPFGINTTDTLFFGFGNSMTSAPAMAILSTSDVGIGGTSGPSNGGKVLFFADNAADPTMGANTAGLYAKDVAGTVEIFAVDEAGNVTQLSAHATDAPL